MKKIIAALLGGTLLGALLVVGFLKLQPNLMGTFLGQEEKKERAKRNLHAVIQDQQNLFKSFDSTFDEDFFRQNDPFEEMKKFREELDKQFPYRGPKSSFPSPFDSWFGDRFGGGSVGDIAKREDDAYVYYDIKLPGADGQTIKTRVNQGFIHITGEEKRSGSKKSESGISTSFQSSSFTRSIPIPENVLAEKMEMVSEGDKIVLKFPKRK